MKWKPKAGGDAGTFPDNDAASGNSDKGNLGMVKLSYPGIPVGEQNQVVVYLGLFCYNV